MIGGLKKLFLQYEGLKRFSALPAESREIVFYAESEAYWPYFRNVIEELCQVHGKRIAYLTSSASDPVLSSPPAGMQAFYIGDGSIRTITFVGMNAGVVVMTTPDLGTSYLKRSKHPVHYVYLPHNMTSTHMVFRKGAFSHFDTVICTGPHQLQELQEAEKLYEHSPQQLVEGGYVRLDDMLERRNADPFARAAVPNRIVIAPTWGENSLTCQGAADVIDSLLGSGYEVIYRPHRVSEGSESKKLDELDDLFGSHPGFKWSKDVSDARPYFGASALVTDWSGSAFSFAFGLERPVLFVDLPKKINNADFEEFNAAPLEVTLREKMGAVISHENAGSAGEAVSRLISKPEEWAETLGRLRGEWCYHVGNAAPITAKHIARIADGLNTSSDAG